LNYTSREQFYTSRTWRRVSRNYASSKQFLCERCLAKGLVIPYEEVHHKTRLTLENLNNPDIALNWNNLECLCKKCHEAEHQEDARLRPYKRKDFQEKGKKPQRRYTINQLTGEVIILSEEES